MPPVGFAVVGLGTLATTAILPAFRAMQRAKLVALVSRDREKARRLAFEHEVPSARSRPLGSLIRGLQAAARSWTWAFIAYRRRGGWPENLPRASPRSNGLTICRFSVRLRRVWLSPCTFPAAWWPRRAPATALPPGSMLYLEGTCGSVSLTPAYPYEHERVLIGRVGDEKILKTFPVVDEFRPQIEAFSLAIRGGPLPPSCGADGYIDMAIIEALYRSATTGAPQDVKVIPSS